MSMMIRDILKMGENMLTNAGVPDPRIDAEALFCYAMHMTKEKLFMSWQEILQDEQCEHYLNVLEVRAGGRPTQYITGSTEFMGLPFEVNESVLIPRQDTETLVETALEIIKESGNKKPRILDLCTGSGAIAVAMARLCGGAAVAACDVSEAAIEVAKRNAALNKVKVAFSVGDLFDPYKGRFGNKKFDYILSNPPYIPTAVIETLQREVRDHEPRMALDGGETGLDFYRIILAGAPAFLREGGRLVLEIGHDQADAVRELARESDFAESEIRRDLAGHDRVAVLR